MEEFAENHGVPMRKFEKGERKEEVARAYFQPMRAKRQVEGVALIGVAQETANAFRSLKHETQPGRPPWFKYYRGRVCVNHFYFYLLDREFGPAFIKVCSYAPFTMRVWLNGHEWAKRRLEAEGIGYKELANGFEAVDDPARLQAVCDELSAADVEAFFRRWTERLPMPMTPEDREVGFVHQLSILQMEVSLTQVFDRPLRGRQFFEEVIRENLDLGRPDHVQLIFGRRIGRRTPGRFRTRVLTREVSPSLHVDYKRSRIKQYYKEGRALRTEMTINNTYDFRVGRKICNLEHLRDLGKNANRRLVGAQCASFRGRLGGDAFEQVVLPSKKDGQRVPALRFGDLRVMALLAALCGFFHLPEGFRNRDLRQRVAALLDGREYSAGQMTYDLRRLRRHGLIGRVATTHAYIATDRGRRTALLLTKSYTRLFRTLPLEPEPPPAASSTRLQRAWHTLDRALDNHLREARLAA